LRLVKQKEAMNESVNCAPAKGQNPTTGRGGGGGGGNRTLLSPPGKKNTTLPPTGGRQIGKYRTQKGGLEENAKKTRKKRRDASPINDSSGGRK